MHPNASAIITAAEQLSLALAGVRRVFADVGEHHPAYAELSLLTLVLERAEDLAGDIMAAARGDSGPSR